MQAAAAVSPIRAGLVWKDVGQNTKYTGGVKDESATSINAAPPKLKSSATRWC